MTDPAPLAPLTHAKLLVFEAALQIGGIVRVRLDARDPDVVVPQIHKQNLNLVLEYGLNLPTPVGDFVIDDRGIAGVLSFSGARFPCFVPWRAVTYILPESQTFAFLAAPVLEPEAKPEAAREAKPEAKPGPKPEPKKRAFLSLVPEEP